MNRPLAPCLGEDPGILQDLAFGRLPEDEAGAALRHVANCPSCRRHLISARQIERGAAELKQREVPDELRGRIWARIAPEAHAAARRLRRGSVLREMLSSPWFGRRPLLWLGGTVAVLLVVWAAYDKISRGGGGGGGGGGEGAAPRAFDAGARSSLVELGSGAAAEAGSSADLHAEARPGGRSPLSASGLLAAAERGGHQSASSLRPSGVPRPRRAPRAPRRLARGSSVDLECGATLHVVRGLARIVRNDRAVAIVKLDRGTVSLRVPSLPAGGRLEVLTPEARVRVKGTRFTVSRSSAGRTHVEVEEGSVWVEPVGSEVGPVVLGRGGSLDLPEPDPAEPRRRRAAAKELIERMDEAIRSGDLLGAERLGRRYLASAATEAGADEVRIRLAGILGRLGKGREAVDLYGRVVRGGREATVRETALALLAVLHERRGRAAEALRAWSDLLRRYPLGLHAHEAAERLVDSVCGRAPGRGQVDPVELDGHLDGDAVLRARLRKCMAGHEP